MWPQPRPPATVRIGACTKAMLREALAARQIQLNTAANALFDDDRFIPLSDERIVPIVAISVAELGFDAGATYGAIVERAREQGLSECPLDLGPHLRLQFLDQAEVEGSATGGGRAPLGSVTIASAALDDAEKTPKGFYLKRTDGALWLRGYWSGADHVWSAADVFVFANERA